jgi:ABC-type glycerol-3-phosphate transport system permease component
MEAIKTPTFWERKSVRDIFIKIVLYIIVLIGAFILMIPFFWMLSTALKGFEEAFQIPPQWIPKPPHWENFYVGWTTLPFGLYLKNTVIIIVLTLIGQIFSASLVAFGFSRLHFPGRDFLFFVMLSTMMIPFQVTMIPTYILFRYLRWIDTFKPLIVPAYFGGGAFFIFLLRQFFLTIPPEMDDAARIDGCNNFNIYLKIILPLAKPALGTVAIFSFMWQWNDFMGPLIYINSMDKRTVALGLAAFQAETAFRTSGWNLIMAVAFLLMLPCLIIFFLAQRQFIQGVVITGVKG